MERDVHAFSYTLLDNSPNLRETLRRAQEDAIENLRDKIVAEGARPVADATIRFSAFVTWRATVRVEDD